MLWTIGHEFYHHLANAPELKTEIQSIYNGMRLTEKGKAARDTDGQEELTADIVGRMLNDVQFWEELSRRKGGTFEKVVDAILEILDRVTDAANSVLGKTDADGYIKNVRAVKRQLRRAVSAHKGIIGRENIPKSADAMNGVEIGGAKFAFAGERGAAKLDAAERSNTRMDNKKIAEEMEAAGRSDIIIKMATGWERGADGKWRYEIPDIEVDADKFNYKKTDTPTDPYALLGVRQKLGDVITAPEVFEAYPEMRKYNVVIVHPDELGGADASWDSKSKKIRLNNTQLYGNNANLKKVVTDNLVHEIQHAIQGIEGFARGTYVKHGDFTTYRRTAGEVEARNVEARLGMPSRERRETMARETEDVAREEQIVSRGRGRAASVRPEFAREIDAWDGKTKVTFNIGTTSAPLKSIGVKDRNIIWHGRKVAEILRKHPEMSKDILKQVPNILENPIIVLKSKNADSRISIFGELRDNKGNPVTAILELNPTGDYGRVLNVNIVASAYGKDTNLAGFIKSSDALYVDTNKKRANDWLQSVGLQLPSGVTNLGAIGQITYTANGVTACSHKE